MVTHARALGSRLLSDASSYLAKVASDLDGSIESVVLTGPPAAEIATYATDRGIDLIIMTSHGRGGIARAALGSVTDRLIGTSIPVLVVRSGQTEAQ
jgi:nucleotide-binding universal stress UspA family protein